MGKVTGTPKIFSVRDWAANSADSLAELHRDSSCLIVGKDARVAGADRREAPEPRPRHLERRRRLRRQPPQSSHLLDRRVQQAGSESPSVLGRKRVMLQEANSRSKIKDRFGVSSHVRRTQRAAGRHGDARAVQPQPERPRPEHEWTRRRNRPAGDVKPPGSGTFRLAGAALGFLAFLAAVVVLIILIWPPSSVGVVLIGADYADNLLIPHNILGWKVIEAIESLCRTPLRWALFKPARLELIGNVHTLDQPDDWDKVIEELVKSDLKNQTILIVASLHGGSDSKTGYLIPTDGSARGTDRPGKCHQVHG